MAENFLLLTLILKYQLDHGFSQKPLTNMEIESKKCSITQ